LSAGPLCLRVKVCGLLRAATRDPEGWLDLEVAAGSRIEEVIDILHERSPALDEKYPGARAVTYVLLGGGNHDAFGG
jgi:hypothetical protein